jgi:HlyD family type I secretion membrane fusion protein
MNGQNGTPNSSSQSDSNQQKPGALALGKRADLTPKSSHAADNKLIRAEDFDQPIILQQPSIWSRAIAMGIVGVTAVTLGWAAIAKMDEAVMATGQLEPQAQVQPLQAPLNGAVVEEIYVKDGQAVKQGDVLIRFDPTSGASERRAAEEIRKSLTQQNQFYRSQLAGSAPLSAAEISGLNLPPEIRSLTDNRAALVAENRVYQAQLNGAADASGLTPEQRFRVQTGLTESQSRTAAKQAAVSQYQEQLTQAQGQLQSARQTLAIEQSVYNDLTPLLKDGGIARLQVTKQEQQVIQARSEVDKLEKETQRLQYAIAQAQQELSNTSAMTGRDLLTAIGTNNKQIAEIDSQINKTILENEKLIADTNNRIRQASLTLKYQELRAPIDGIIFDLKAKGRGYVANQSEPILKIVPNNNLIAEVYVTNKDIGFVKEGMHVDVRVDSFPFSEFGDIRGKLVNIGSDALPPDQIHNYYRFPAKVEIDRQAIRVQDKDVPLQSGMSVSANIITRKRTVLSIFTDMFSRKVDGLKNVR